MKYVFLAYCDNTLLDALPPAERGALCDASAANDEALRASGHLLAAQGVQRGDMATTVRVQNGDLELDAGPHAQSREELAGLFFIEAIQIASQMPQARGGPIEVRPLAP